MFTFGGMCSLRLSLLFFLIFTIFSCSKDEEEVVPVVCDGSNLTYNSGISAIINSNCNASNCHGNNSSHGSYTSFAELQTVMNNGKFNSRVLITQDMPQGSATLTQSQLNKLKCWVDNGFPEN